MNGQYILHAVGFEGFLPPVCASFILYLLAFCCCLSIYLLSHAVFPKKFHRFTSDFAKTLLICTFPYGHGLIRNHYGHVGYCLAAVPLVVITLNIFKDGQGSPLCVFMEFLEKKLSSAELILRICVQTVAGFASYRLVSYIWSLELHQQHVDKLHASSCVSDLTVPVVYGFLIEFVGVLCDTLVSLQTWTKRPLVNMTAKVMFSTLLVCCGVYSTGMYMHPAMASGVSFGCHGLSNLEHIFVYWVATFSGLYAAFKVNSFLSLIKNQNTDTKSNGHVQKNGIKHTTPVKASADANQLNENTNSNGYYTRSKAKHRKS